MTRYPALDLASFIALCSSRSEARTLSKFAGTEFNKAEKEGLSVEQADRLAVRVGRHPSEVWADWLPIVALEETARRRAQWAASARRRYHADPEHRERRREYMREYRANARVALKAQRDRWRVENAERWREKHAEYMRGWRQRQKEQAA